LTPAGTGAIATIAIRGPEAWNIVQNLFRPLSKKTAWPPERLEPGHFWPGYFGVQGGITDQVVLAVKAAEPVPALELHCHGGAEVVRWVLELLGAKRMEICSWQEVERRTTADAAATGALAEALTARTAAIVLEQYQGAFARAVASIREALERNDLAEAGRLLEHLVHYAPLGRHLSAPWRVAVLGAPNVGKSSLVNALAGYQRSIVAPTPGTTRDVVTALIAVDGWPVELADTAGLRDTPGGLEAQGMERARGAAERADLCLWLLDASSTPVWPESRDSKLRFLINKIDLPRAWDLGQAEGAMRLSATMGAGLPELCAALARWLVPDPPLPGAAVPYTPELSARIEEAWASYRSGRLEDVLQVLASI
jgi:tRNA modification GTPase